MKISSTNKENINILDIGGGRGYGDIFKSKNINYYILDLNIQKKIDNINYIQGDITDKNLKLPCKFDLIFTKDTYEHILNPWDSTDNIINNLNETGIFFIIVPFSWRYHASPYDTYRYTHTGLQYLFERNNKLKKIISGYTTKKSTNGFWKNKKDYTLDVKPFNECIHCIYIGEKNEQYIFNKNVLDADLSNDHSN